MNEQLQGELLSVHKNNQTYPGAPTELHRPVNDLDFDVALHLVFQTKADHDAYQAAPLHDRFIAENKGNWKIVRVFDSLIG